MAALSEQALGSLRQALVARAAELAAEVRAVDDEQAGTPGSATGSPGDDLADRGEQRTREAVRHAERERDIDELRAIEAALARMAEGRYGECSDCGAGIPLARLTVQPAALRCVACQARFEATHPAAAPVPPVPLPPLVP